jgi:hypothetical protein
VLLAQVRTTIADVRRVPLGFPPIELLDDAQYELRGLGVMRERVDEVASGVSRMSRVTYGSLCCGLNM